MTSRHTGGNVTPILTVIQPLDLILNVMGHKVFQKVVTVGEDLSVYDKIFLFVFPPEKIGVTRRYGAIDCYARYKDKCVLCFDDWQYYQFQGAILNCARSGRFWNWVDKFPGFARKEDVKAIITGGKIVRDRIMEAAIELGTTPGSNFCIPKFSWGNLPMRLTTKKKVFTFDPSRFAIDWIYNHYDLEFPPIKRERRWVLASLFEHDKYIHNLTLTWPILRVGHKKTQQVYNEEQLCKIYQDNWGILSPNYPTSGDGWWRARWIFSYMFENIMLVTPQEMGSLKGFSFVPNITEQAKEDKLEALAKFQKETLEKNFMQKEEVITIFKEMLK
jgi:hypothetical protein